MPNFNASDYFARRNQENAANEAANPIQDKYLEVQAASQRSVDKLLAQGQQQDALKEANKNATVNKLGLQDTFTGDAFNTLASGIVGGVRTFITNPLAGAVGSWGDNVSGSVPDEVHAALQRMREGTGTEADQTMLNLPAGVLEEPEYKNARDRVNWDKYETNQQRVLRGQKSIDFAEAIRAGTDISWIRDSTKQNAVQEAAGASYDAISESFTGGRAKFDQGDIPGATADMAKGVQEILMTLPSIAWEHPGGVIEYIAENLPQVALTVKFGLPGMAASVLPYAAEEYAKGTVAYQEANNGAFPPEEVRRKNAMYAASLAASEGVGQLGMAGKLGAEKLISKMVGRVATEGTEQATRTGFKKVLEKAANSGAARVASGTIGGASSEFVTESWQTHAEGQIQGKDASLRDIFIGGTIGALAGGGTSGGIQTGRELGVGVVKALDSAVKSEAERAKVRAAIETNDPSAFLDPKSKNFAPEKGVAILLGSSKLETTTEAVKEQNLEKATEIVVDLETKLAGLKAVQASQSPEGKVAMQAELSDYQGRLAEATAAGNQKDITKFTSLVQMVEQQVKNFVLATPEELAKDSKAIKVLEKQAEETRKVQTSLKGFLAPKEADIVTLLEESVSIDPVVAQRSSSKLVRLAMTSPDKLTADQINSLEKDTNNGLLPDQRSYLRDVSAARLAENKVSVLGSVNNDVLGTREDRKHAGIKQYRERIGEALLAGRQDLAAKNLALLATFLSGHQDKLTMFNAAIESFSSNNVPVQVVPTKQGWEVARQNYDREALSAIQGIQLDGMSGRLMATVKAEVIALEAAQKELTAAYELKFNSTESTQAANAAPVVKKPVEVVPNQSNVDSTVNSEASTPSTTAPTAPVVDSPVLKKIVEIGKKLLGKASKVSSPVNEAFLSENADVGTLLSLLGVTHQVKAYDQAPSEHTILTAQARVLELYKKLEANPFILGEVQKELNTLFGWLQSTEGTNSDREARARKGAHKYGKGNDSAHLLIQLVEELGEMAAAVSTDKTTTQDNEIQKRALKVIRFGGDTVIKQEGPYKGKTNQKAFDDLVRENQSQSESDSSTSKQKPEYSPVAKELVDGRVGALIQKAKASIDMDWILQTLEDLTTPINNDNRFYGPLITETTNVDQVEAAASRLYVALEARLDVLEAESKKNKPTKATPSPVVSDPSPVSIVSTKSVEEETRLEEDKSSNQTSPVVPSQEKEGNISVTESPNKGYRERTIRNANAGDVTIAFAADYTTAGERLTRNSAGNKYVAYKDSVQGFVDAIVAKLKANKGTTINVAGNGLQTWSKHNRTQEWVNDQMFEILSKVKEQYPAFSGIVTGGQTGTDIAGAVAAHALGLLVDVHMPNGFLQRNAQGRDFTQTAADVQRYIKAAAKKVKRDTSLSPAVLAQISAERNGIPIREANETEQKLLDRVVARMVEKVGSEVMDQVDRIVIMDPKEATKNAGYATRIDGKIYLAIKASVLSMDRHPTTLEIGENYVTRVLTHEVGHVFDNTYFPDSLVSDQGVFGKEGTIRKEVNALIGDSNGKISKALLAINARLAALDQGDTKTAEKLNKAKEKLAARLSGDLMPFWKKFFFYHLAQVSEAGVRTELFAQLYTMYHLFPELMSEYLPTTKARFDTVYGRQTSSQTQEDAEAGYYGEGSLAARRRDDDAGTYEIDDDFYFEEAGEIAPEGDLQAEANLPIPNRDLGSRPATGLALMTRFNESLVGQKIGEYFASRQLNHIAQFLTQQAKSARTGLMRPLVAVPDLMSAIRAGLVQWADYLPLDRFNQQKLDIKANEHMKLALENMAETIQSWLPEIADNMEYKKLKEEFLTQDMMQHFFEPDEQGNPTTFPEENVLTAIGYGMYAYIVDKAGSPAYKTKEDIAVMHGFKKETKVSREGENALRMMDSFENAAVEAIGEKIVQALGLKTREGAPKDLLPKLKSAMGIHGLVMLSTIKGKNPNDVPFIKRHFLEFETVNNFFDQEDGAADMGETGDTVIDPTQAAGINKEKTNTYIEFVHIKDGKKTVLPQRVITIRGANRDSDSAVDNFFGVDTPTKWASTTPMEFTQTHSKDTNMPIPAEQVEALKKVTKAPHTAIKTLVSLLDDFALGSDGFLEIAGTVNMETISVHDINKKSVEAQNMNLENQLDMVMEMFATHGSDTKFHVLPEVWMNFRVGFFTKSLDQQASKIHRALFGRPEWTVEIDSTNVDLMNEFKIAVAMNLGFKTDSTVNAVTLPEIDKFLARDDIMKAARDIGQGVTQEKFEVFTPESKRNIIDTAKNNGGMMGLQALVAYSEFLLAQEQGNTKFTITMLVGADGKTSGPMLTHMALGTEGTLEAMYTRINRGGFFKHGKDEAKHYGEYAGSGKGDSLDLYQSLASKVVEYSHGFIATSEAIAEKIAKAYSDKELKKALKYFTKEQYAALEVITKRLAEKSVEGILSVTSAGRNLVKTPLTAFGFGSSLTGSVKSMKKQFIEGIYKHIQDLDNRRRHMAVTSTDLKGNVSEDAARKILSDKLRADTKSFIDALNVLFEMGGSSEFISSNTLIEKMLTQTLSPSRVDFVGQEEALLKAFDKIIGAPVKVTMDTYFRNFINRRDNLNKTVQGSYAIYEVVYREERAKEVERLMATGDIASRRITKGKQEGKLEPLHDMNAEQEAALEAKLVDVMPTMNHAMSLEESKSKSGLLMAKTEKGATTNKLYHSVVKFAQGITATTGKETTLLKADGFIRRSISPGIAGLSYMIHSLDSGIMNKAVLYLKDVLSIHDEGAGGVHQVKDIALALNKATADYLFEYSPATETNKMFQRLLSGIAGRITRGEMSNQAIVDLVMSWDPLVNKYVQDDQKTSLDQVGHELLKRAYASAHAADLMRMEVHSTLGHVDQYPWEGGQYEVPQSRRDEAAKNLKALIKKGNKPPANVTAAMDVIREAFRKAKVIKPSKPVAVEVAGPIEPVTSTAEFGLPGVISAVTLDRLAENSDLFKGIAQQVREGQSLVDVINALPEADKALAIQMLADASSEVDTDVSTPWGDIGTPTIAPVQALKDFFSNEPNQTAGSVIAMLQKHLQTTGKYPSYGKLLNVLVRIVPADMQVLYLTPSTPLDAVPGGKFKDARGWYQASPETQTQAIYLLSAEHQQSGLTEELLVHELLHAALQQLVNFPTAAVAPYLAELQTLFEAAQTFLKGKTDLSNEFVAAMSSMDEFLSWGMTNKAFQQAVLNKISIAGPKNAFTTGLQKFITTVTNMVYSVIGRKITDTESNGIGTLIGNVSEILNQAMITAETGKVALQGPTASLSMAAANQASNRDIYDALDGKDITPVFGVHLDQVMSLLNDAVHAPFAAIKAELQANQAMTPNEAYEKALMTGNNPFDAQSTVAPLLTSERVGFVMEQVEATVRTVLDYKGFFKNSQYSALERLHKEMEATLKAEDFYTGNDWNTATLAEKQEAQEELDYLFKHDATGKQLNHLARFVALGTSHPKINAILNRDTKKKQKQEKYSNFGERITSWLQSAISWFIEKRTHTYAGQKADIKLMLLLDQLVDIEAKRREKFIQDSQPGMLDAVTNSFGRAGTKVMGGVSTFVQKPFFTNNKNGYIAGGGAVIGILAKERVIQITEMAMAIRNEKMESQLGITAGLVNDVLGPRPVINKLLRLVKNTEKHRHWLNDQTAKHIKKSFVNEGKDIDSNSSSSVTYVMLRTGMADLLGKYSIKELHTLLKDNTALQAEIRLVEGQLGQFGSKQHAYMKKSRDTAYHMVTNASQSEGILMNAQAIAMLSATTQHGKVSRIEVNRAIPVIDTLISLYAMSYSYTADKEAAIKVFDAEMARTDGGNGIEVLLELHKSFLKEAKETLFKGSEVLAAKGHVPEILDPHTEVVTANAKQGEKLVKMGYGDAGKVTLDPADPDRKSVGLYVLKNGGLHSRTTGMMSATNTHAKGSLKDTTGKEFYNIAMERKKAEPALFKADRNYDPAKRTGTFMVPVLNHNGEVTGNRYLMKRKTKDAIHNRTNDFDLVMGSLASQTYDKQNTPENNRKVVALMKEIYDKEYTTQTGAFLEISPNSRDPELREAYRLLPTKTKEAVKAIWGDEPMMVRSELIGITFGYKNKSQADMFVEGADNNKIQKMIVRLVEDYLKADHTPEAREIARKRAEIWTRSKGEMWGEVVKEVKDNIVNKTGTVLGWNIFSNVTVLKGFGVSTLDIVRHHVVAFRGALAYRKSTERLYEIQLQLNGGYTRGNEAALRREMAQVENDIARNPVTMFMEEGLMPTIVEDIEPDALNHSYKSKMAKRMEKYTSRLHPTVRKVAKNVYMTHDTKLYQGLAYLTQLSDFVARYTLYQHNVNKKDAPMTHEAAIHRASISFVNYDVPMHRDIQYLDSAGILMFTKFFTRIQRVLMIMLKENPGNVAALILLDNYVGAFESVMETSALARFGNNPAHMGILEFPRTLENLIPVNAGLSLIQQ